MNETELIKNGWIELGVGVNSHGIKGGITLKLFNDDIQSSILDSANDGALDVYLIVTNNPKLSKTYSVVKASLGNKPIIYLEGVNRIEEVEPLIPFRLFVNRADFPPVESEDGVEEFYNVDLIGLNVISFTGESVGVLADIYENGAQSVLVIRVESGTRFEREFGRQFELPFIDNFVKSVDLDLKKIVIELPEYE